MNDFMNSEELKELLKPIVDKLLPFYVADIAAKTTPAPTLSEMLTEGNKRIDDAVEADIAGHEKEIAYDESIKAEAERETLIVDVVYNRQQHFNSFAMAQAQEQYHSLQQMNEDRRNAMNQSQDQFGRWI